MKAKHPGHLPYIYTSDTRAVSSNSSYKPSKQTTPSATFAEILHQHQSNSSLLFLNKLLKQAASISASHIYIEPEDSVLRIRYRTSGELNEETEPTNDKKFDITELLTVLYGNIEAPFNSTEPSTLSARLGITDYDLTVMPLRTTLGLSLTIALNKKMRFAPTLDELELPHFTLKQLRDILEFKTGFLLLAGSVACATQLTRLAILQALNTPDCKIISIEKHPSLTLPRVSHVPLAKGSKPNGSYSHYLLQQAPDICSIDHLAHSDIFGPLLEATLNNTRLIASTQAPSAISALLQLKALGYNRHMIAQSLRGILIQQKVPKVCTACKKVHRLSSLDKKWIQQNFPGEVIVEGRFTIGEGCNSCANTGLSSTCTIYELISSSEELCEAIILGDNSSITTALSLRSNFQTLKQKAFSLANKGIIPLQQVMLIQM